MKSTRILSYKQLYKEVKAGDRVCFVYTRTVGVICCVATLYNGSVLLLNKYLGEPMGEPCRTDFGVFGRYFDVCYENMNRGLYHEMDAIILMDRNFSEGYVKFLTENKRFIESFGIHNPDDFHISQYVYFLSDGSKNLYSWAMRELAQKNAHIEEVIKILSWYGKNKTLCSKLSLGTITAYSGNGALMGLIKEIEDIKKNKIVLDAIKCFNTKQKKLLTQTPKSDRDLSILRRFNRLSGIKKNNFIRKVSTVLSAREILKQMEVLVEMYFQWSKENFINYLNNIGNLSYEIVYENGDVVLLKVFDYETMKRLAKTTSWCISKCKESWDEYVSEEKYIQFILFDFSKKEDDNLSIIGFTVAKANNIVHAHNFRNDDIVADNYNDRTGPGMHSYISRYLKNRNILGILSECGIPRNVISYPNEDGYEWDREAALKRMEDLPYMVLSDMGNKMAIECDFDTIMKIVGRDSNVNSIEDVRAIAFLDFTVSSENDSRVLFFLVNWNEMGTEMSMDFVTNASGTEVKVSPFMKFIEYGLCMEEVLCVDTDPSWILHKIIATYDVNAFRHYMNDDKFLRNVMELDEKRKGLVVESMISNAIGLDTDEFMDIMYGVGFKLLPFMGEYEFIRLFKRMIQDISMRRPIYDPVTEKHNEMLKKGRINDQNMILYICVYNLISRMIDEECVDDYSCSVFVKALEYIKVYDGDISNAVSLITGKVIKFMDEHGNIDFTLTKNELAEIRYQWESYGRGDADFIRKLEVFGTPATVMEDAEAISKGIRSILSSKRDGNSIQVTPDAEPVFASDIDNMDTYHVTATVENQVLSVDADFSGVMNMM